MKIHLQLPKNLGFAYRALILIVLLVLILPAGLSARTLVVGEGGGYPTIGEALTAARDGDLIEVREGSYQERLTIDKSIHLKGMNNPVLSVPDGVIVEISRPDVVFEGFTLEYDSTELSASDTAIRILKEAERTIIRNNRLVEVMFGIWNVEGRDLRIENNTISGIKELAK